MAKAWVNFANIRTEGVDDVDDLRRAVKVEMAPKLNEYAAADLTIRAALIGDKMGSQATELEPEDTLQSILNHFGVADKSFVKNIHFFVDVPPKGNEDFASRVNIC